MATIEDLERRLAELERWRENEQRVMLQHLLDTQSEQTRMLIGIETTLGQHTRALANLETEMGNLRLEMRTGFQMLANLIDPENESGPDDPS